MGFIKKNKVLFFFTCVLSVLLVLFLVWSFVLKPKANEDSAKIIDIEDFKKIAKDELDTSSFTDMGSKDREGIWVINQPEGLNATYFLYDEESDAISMYEQLTGQAAYETLKQKDYLKAVLPEDHAYYSVVILLKNMVIVASSYDNSEDHKSQIDSLIEELGY